MSLDATPAPATPDVSTPPPSSTPEPAPAAPVESKAPAAPEPSIDDELSKVWAKSNPDRDDSGRFVSRETPVEQSELAEKLNGTETLPVVEKPPETPKPAVEPPRAWTAEQKALWAKIAPEAQPLVAQREQELQDIRSAAGRLTAEYKPIKHVLDGYKPYLDQVAKGDAAGYLNQLLAASHALDTNPSGTIKELAKMYGVDLGQLYDPLETPPNQEIVELRREIASLRSSRDADQRARAAYQQAAQAQTFEQVVADFAKANPDALEIESEIAAEINFLRQTKPNLDPAAMLKEAFDRAAWSNEKMRAKRIDAQAAERQKADEEKRVAAAKEAAAKAKTAASVNVSGRAQTAAETPDDLDQALRQTFRKAAAR